MNTGTPQHIAYLRFLDCLKRTKRKQGYKTDFKQSGDLIYGVLGNSSVVEHDSERSYQRVCDAVGIIQKFLCPGVWCCRSHCENHCTRSAYNCTTKRPAICKEYADYRKKQIKKMVSGKFFENEEAKNQLSWLLADMTGLFDESKKYRFQDIIEENICAGIYYDESVKKYISFHWEEDMFLIIENKKEINAIESLFYQKKYTKCNLIQRICMERELIQRIYTQKMEGKL
jgi:hypothetical protein